MVDLGIRLYGFSTGWDLGVSRANLHHLLLQLGRGSSSPSADGLMTKTPERSPSPARPPDPPESEYNYKSCLPTADAKERLFQAAKDGDNEAIFDLYMRRQELTGQDDEGNTALHVAAAAGMAKTCRMIVVLAAPKTIWKVQNYEGKTAEEVATSEEVGTDLHTLRHEPKRKKYEVNSMVNDQLADSKTVWEEQDLVALCFDGGGARGFIHAQLLLHVEKKLEGNLMDYVDWVGGTSCGGILALMMATGSSISYFRHSLFRKRNVIFCGNKGKFPKHNAVGIETVNRRQFGDARMSAIRQKKVFVTVADSRKTPISMILFRNYRPRIPDALMEKYQFLDPDRILIWKAARCTSAAPYYFDSFHGYTDGGIVANNPTLALISDFMLVNKLERYFGLTEEIKLEAGVRRLGCVISLGTGQQPVEQTDGIDVNIAKVMAKKNPWKIARNIMAAFKSAKNMMQVLIKECTSSNGQPVRYAREWCHSLDVPYFRLTPQLSADVPLDTTGVDQLMDMLWETEIYVHGEAASDVARLVRLMRLRKRPPTCTTAKGSSDEGTAEEEAFVSTATEITE